MRPLSLFVVVTLLAVWPAVAGGADHADERDEVVTERGYDRHGRLEVERGYMARDPDLGFERHYWLAPVDDHAKPDHAGGKGNGGGNGGGDGGGGSDPGTDCRSDKFVHTGWVWQEPYQATASQHAAVFDAAGDLWQAHTATAIFAGITAGSAYTAGVQDFHNQIDFAPLGTSGTIAVTTTWYYTSTGVPVESDGQYNTNYAWATDGSPGAMDVLNIAAHEVGHTFGLDHPNGNPRQISCLTMYAYADAGETQKQTLGDGDILGLQALYGA